MGAKKGNGINNIFMLYFKYFVILIKYINFVKNFSYEGINRKH